MASLIYDYNSFYNDDQLYPYPTHVNTANFLSIKLSGKTNYRSWQEQMTCLLDSHDMLGFIDGTLKCNQGKGKRKSQKINHNTEYRDWKRSDTLVKGWIFGSLTEDVMNTVVGLQTSHHVWKQLQNNYALAAPTVSDQDSSKYRSLYGAVVNGHWEKAREFFIHDTSALTGKINDDDDSPLHVAIGTCQNIHFVENLLEKIESTRLRTLVCKKGQNPLHRAALVGNTKAAEKLVTKNPNLLFILDNQGLLPIHRAIFGTHVNTFLYLMDVTNDNIELSKEEGHATPFKGRKVPALLTSIIGNGLFDVAYELINKYPDMARTKSKKDFAIPLKSIAGKLDAYFSGRKYNFYQNFVYHHLPIEEHNLGNAHQIDQDIENQVLEPTTPNANGRRSCFHSVICFMKAFIVVTSNHQQQQHIGNSNTSAPTVQRSSSSTAAIAQQQQSRTTALAQQQQSITAATVQQHSHSTALPVIRWIYAELWKVLLHVAHVKRLQEDKVKHNKALLVLKCICKELQKIEKESELREHYVEAVLLALEHDNTEAIEEIIKSFPQAIWTTHNDLHLIQLSIVNRCKNVYSFLVHKAVTDKHVHKTLNDKDGNNILHLAGQLAPIHKLNMVSGAALQMQMELQWFKEVKKFALSRSSKTNNKKQETPIMVFRREHKALRKEGEEWMKKTADSYTITAALIITVVFAAAITVPGGNFDKTGKPRFAGNPGFIVFVVSDAISLFTAITSLLLCLSILTTRYRDEDFLYRLPNRLIIGLCMLFLSVTFMMIAFSATLYITFAHGKAWILFPIAALTFLPIIFFMTLQLPLLFDLCSSTYGQGIFGKRNDKQK